MKVIKHDLPQFETLEIYPLADVHIGDPLHDKKRAKQFINEVLEKENRYVIVNGDIINNAVKHGVSDVYAEELTPNQQIEETVNLLNPIKDRILVITEGNHENRTYKQDGILIMYQVAQRLEPLSRIEFSRQVTRRFNYEIVDKKIDGKKYRVFQKRSDY